MNHLQRIRKEYGEPVKDVIKGFGEMGYSKRLTARTLGVCSQTLYRWLDRFDLRGCFLPQSQQALICQGGVRQGANGGWPKGAPRFHRRKPIEHKGVVYHPGEPMYHYLYERGIR